jgi:CheY-like chemotaxis protein
MEKSSVLVLVAEDEAEIRDVLQDAFEEGGFDVFLVSTGEEAIAALDTQGEALRAVVTDINLGGEATGWDVARHARRTRPDMPVVYMTGTEGAEWASLGVPNSILITKPFAPSQVLTAVSQLLNATIPSVAPPGD